MKVQSLYLENVRGLPSMRLDFVDPVSQKIRPRTVIAGSNGSGKTTILEAIGQLLGFAGWKILRWIEFDSVTAQLHIAAHPTDDAATLKIDINADGSIQIGYIDESNGRMNTTDGLNSGKMRLYHPADQILTQIKQAENDSANFPNCIYFPSEGRQLQKKETGEVIAETSSYEWVYRFSDSQKWRGSLESFLSSLYWRDLQTWYDESKKTNGHAVKAQNQGEFLQFVKIINGFLSGKQIEGVDRQTFRVQIKTDNGLELSFDQLSSGEKQIILLLGEIQRRIQHGSIIMIDEPEIHLHPRWQRMLMRALTDLCEAYNAQLIITTQSEEIANTVYEHELILLDRIFESGDAQALEDLQLS